MVDRLPELNRKLPEEIVDVHVETDRSFAFGIPVTELDSEHEIYLEPVYGESSRSYYAAKRIDMQTSE